jgi:tight adherence protein B
MLNLILWTGGGLAVLLFFIGLVTSLTSEKSLVDERIGQVTETGRPIIPERDRAKPLTDWLNQQVAGSSYGNRVARDLARADLKM